MFAHLSALLGYFVGIGHFLGPLIIYLVKKDTSPFVAQEAKEALNFQITILILGCAGGVLIALFFVTLIGIPIAFLLIGALILLAIVNLILPIVAGITANGGSGYRYPFAIRLVR